MESWIKIHKFGVSDLLKEGWRHYHDNFADILRVVLCAYIPINIILALISNDFLVRNYGPRIGSFLDIFVRLLLTFSVAIATVSIAWIVEKSVHGKLAPWKKSFDFGLSKWLEVLTTGLLGALILFGLTLLLIVPGIIWSLYYSFGIYVVALRKKAGKAALDYSKSLIQGYWWDIFGIFFIMGVLETIVVFAVVFPLTFAPSSPIFNFIANTFLEIAGAFFIVVTTLFFLNLDYRKKASDAEARARKKDHVQFMKAVRARRMKRL